MFTTAVAALLFDSPRVTAMKFRVQVTLGLYIIRGDNIAIVGEVDEQVDGATDWSKKKAEPLKQIVH